MKWLIRAACTLYAIFLLVTPFEHHDLRCELQTPLHCTACATTALGSNLQTADTGGSWHPQDVGRAPVEIVVWRQFLRVVRSNGRAPPLNA